MSQAKELLIRFLTEEKLVYVDTDDLEDFVEKNFDVFTEGILRTLISRALEERDSRLLRNPDMKEELLMGDWGIVIDEIKNSISKHREIAVRNMQTLVALSKEENPKKVIVFLRTVSAKKELDYIFVNLIKESMSYCHTNGDSDNAAMFQFTLDVIERLSPNLVPPTSRPPAPSIINHDGITDNDKAQAEMIRIGDYLNNLLRETNGNAGLLKERVLQAVQSREIDSNLLQKVLDDNIAACKAAGYGNKTKLFQFVKDAVVAHAKSLVESKDSDDQEVSSSHHAPQFIDENSHLKFKVLPPSVPGTLIEGEFAGPSLHKKALKKTKNKNEKREVKFKIGSLAQKLIDHLTTHGWAICDHFLPLDLVRRIRIEAAVFTAHYEEAEIWVGKKADVGAQLTVPSVRGDKVLWMCGAHQHAPEGVTRHVKTIGEVEPCKIEAKAAAPIRKFAALKELITTCDRLVEELKPRCPCLQGLFERTDVMLTIYPGKGARFANHIDNTTQDGRRLTMVIYLNPDWTPELGGSLRITEVPLPEFLGLHSIAPPKAPPAHKNGLPVDLSNLTITHLPSTTSSTLESPSNEKNGNVVEVPSYDVLPEAGRLAIFFSSVVPHEVLPAYGDRHALTLWYYDKEERQQAIDRARQAGKSMETAATSVQAQKDAKEFMTLLVGKEDYHRQLRQLQTHTPGVEEAEVLPSQQELDFLCQKVQELSMEALKIVASITGAPSVESFREGFKLLTPQDLHSMRDLFSRMGLST